MATVRWRVCGEVPMRALGAAWAQVLPPGACLLLSGPLGAGKTTLTQGIGAGLGVAEAVTSPTFTLVREHTAVAGRPGLVHVDCYRLGGAAEARDLGLVDYLDGADVVVVEWPERAPGVWPATALRVQIAVAGPCRRLALMTADARLAAALGGLVPPPGVTVE